VLSLQRRLRLRVFLEFRRAVEGMTGLFLSLAKSERADPAVFQGLRRRVGELFLEEFRDSRQRLTAGWLAFDESSARPGLVDRGSLSSELTRKKCDSLVEAPPRRDHAAMSGRFASFEGIRGLPRLETRFNSASDLCRDGTFGFDGFLCLAAKMESPTPRVTPVRSGRWDGVTTAGRAVRDFRLREPWAVAPRDFRFRDP